MENTEVIVLLKVIERLDCLETRVIEAAIEAALRLARINAQLEALLARRG